MESSNTTTQESTASKPDSSEDNRQWRRLYSKKFFFPLIFLTFTVFIGSVVLISFGHHKLSGSQKNRGKISSPTRRQPHIVFVFADDLGWHDIGYHGSRIQTPNLDKLAEGGVRLENYYAQPMCSPSRSQFMTGRYQIHMGIQHDVFRNERPSGLPLDNPTLTDKLREAGYATHQVGKWHLGFFKEDYLPNNRGFDSSFCFVSPMMDYFNHTWRYRNFGDFLDLRLNGEPAYNYSGQHSNYMFTRRSVDLIHAHDKNKPMFLYLSYQAPHAPYLVPESYSEQYRDIDNEKRRRYAGLVTMMDEGIQNVIEALRKAGMWEDTIFIFSSDNGGANAGVNYPLRGQKLSNFEGGVRVVGFVTAGSNIEMVRGVVNKELIHVSDWFPTLLGVAGGNLDGTKPLDGLDQWETISKGTPTKRTWLLHNIDIMIKPKGKPKFNDTFDTCIQAALRMGDFKIITGNVTGAWITPPEMTHLTRETPSEPEDKNLWLFNISADPEERHDLSEERPDLVREMLDFLLEINATAIAPWFPDIDPRSDPRENGGVWGPWL